VTIESMAGMGTRFSIFLPASAEVAAAAQDARERTGTAPGTETVLLVEDEEAVRRLVSAVLESQGYHVIAAPDGEEALTLAKRPELEFDLLLTDVVMPRLSGPELATRMRAARPDIKVVFMSGYAGETILQRGGLAEDAPFLAKPFTGDELLHTVRQALEPQTARVES
jgi:CheY-like chemotaxis protein